MKKVIVLLLSSCMLLSLCACGKQDTTAQTNATEPTAASTETETASGDNLLPGGEFEELSSNWGLYMESGGDATIEVIDGKLVTKIANAGTVAHAVQVYCDGFEMLEGAKYQFSCEVTADVERTIDWRIQINGSDYHQYAGEEKIKVGPDTQTISCTFTMEEASDPAPRFCFNMGDKDSAQGLSAHSVTFDNVSLILLDASNAKKVEVVENERDINLNQVGYKPKDNKIATVRNASSGSEFVVKDASGKTVYTGKLEGSCDGGTSGDVVSYADFSSLTAEGTYHVELADGRTSYDFTIGAHVYDAIMDDVVRMLYLQRCGSDLTAEYAGDFAHKACHTAPAVIYGTNETIDVSGGWHDAGDYGRYVSPGAKTVADILLAYENYPEAFSDKTNIPESGNGVPDVLDEARYELTWMLKMQDPVDGGVYHKATNKNFEGVTMPENCTDTVYVIMKSQTATADYAAAMFMAARVYQSVDPEFASTCRKAASLALDYFEKHISEAPYKNPSDVATGEYGDSSALDEYFWALCEDYKTTGSTSSAEKIKNFDYSKIENQDGLGWIAMTEYGYYAYLTAGRKIDGLKYDMKAAFLAYADEVVSYTKTDAYKSSILGSYPWGSNMTIANNGMLLLMAKQITGDDRYLDPAKDQLHYLLGNNSTSYCFVSGYGSLSPEHSHHRPSQSLGQNMKGMLAGGPNSGLEDPYAQNVLQGKASAKCYVDNDQSYSTNEITIYWNSPLIYLLAGLK